LLENWLKTRGKRLANIAKLPELLRKGQTENGAT